MKKPSEESELSIEDVDFDIVSQYLGKMFEFSSVIPGSYSNRYIGEIS